MTAGAAQLVAEPGPIDIAAARAQGRANRARGYAAKWIVEHDLAENPDHADPTDEALAACFAHCARPARPDEYDTIRDAIGDRRIQLGIVTARHPLALVPRGRPWPPGCTGNFRGRRHDWLILGPVTACGACGRIEGVDDVAALVGGDGRLVRLPGQLQAHQEGHL
jgi:hypothetical protein